MEERENDENYVEYVGEEEGQEITLVFEEDQDVKNVDMKQIKLEQDIDSKKRR
jgi:hypothetical protein